MAPLPGKPKLSTLAGEFQKLDAKTPERLEKQVREKLGANEFLRARIRAGKLTPQCPDWTKARHDLLREALGKTS